MALALSLVEWRGGEGGGQTSAACCFGFHFASACPCFIFWQFWKAALGHALISVGVPFLLLFPSLSRFEWTLPLFGQQNELNCHLYFILLHL